MEQIKIDVNDPDICGPWTKAEDYVNADGSIKYFKHYWFINTGDAPANDILPGCEAWNIDKNVKDDVTVSYFRKMLNKLSKLGGKK